MITKVKVMAVSVMMGLFLTMPVQTTVLKAAEFTAKKNGVIYNCQDCVDRKNSIEIIGIRIKNASKKLVIPAKLAGFKVYGLGDDWSMDIQPKDTVLDELVIENGVKVIRKYAFTTLHAKKISIPKSMEKIGYEAFGRNKNLKKITIKSPKVRIGELAFWGSDSLTSIRFTCKSFSGQIKKQAFGHCNLKEIKFPYMKKMKKQIGLWAFDHNKNLKKITFDNRNRNITIGNEWFSFCPNAQITIGKKVKTFSSEVNTEAGSVRLLGKETKFTGFPKIVKETSGPKAGTYVTTDNPVVKDFKYYIQYKKIIVPKKSKALSYLKKAYYGDVTWKEEEMEEFYDSEENAYFYRFPLKKVECVVKG